MLSELIRIYEKIIEQLQKRALSRQEIFRSAVDPLYERMKIVGQDYISLVRMTESLERDLHELETRLRQDVTLSSWRDELEEKQHEFKKLQNRRDAFVLERLSLRVSANKLADTCPHQEVARFASMILAFFEDDLNILESPSSQPPSQVSGPQEYEFLEEEFDGRHTASATDDGTNSEAREFGTTNVASFLKRAGERLSDLSTIGLEQLTQADRRPRIRTIQKAVGDYENTWILICEEYENLRGSYLGRD